MKNYQKTYCRLFSNVVAKLSCNVYIWSDFRRTREERNLVISHYNYEKLQEILKRNVRSHCNGTGITIITIQYNKVSQECQQQLKIARKRTGTTLRPISLENLWRGGRDSRPLFFVVVRAWVIWFFSRVVRKRQHSHESGFCHAVSR